MIWIPAFGSVALFDAWVFAIRIDLHARTVLAMGPAFWQVAGAVVAVLVVGQVAAMLLLVYTPFLGLVLSAFAGLYTWFTAAHLVGVLMREHHDLVEKMYWRGA